MPRHRISRRKSQRKIIIKLLSIGLCLVLAGAAIFFVSNYFKNRQQTVSDSRTQTHVAAPKGETTTTMTTDSSSQTSFDLEAIASGNYASAKGTWKNEAGDSLTLNDTGLETASIQGMTSFSLTPYQLMADGVYQATLAATDGSMTYSLIFIKAGTTIPAELFVSGYSDTSDTQKNRLYITSQALGDDHFNSNVLYQTAN